MAAATMSVAEADIDLYDTIEEDFSQEHEDDLLNGGTSGTAPSNTTDDAADLYDDVLTSAVKTEPKDDENGIASNSDGRSTDGVAAAAGDGAPKDFKNYYQRRFQVYISNLTWWTNDVDVTQACNAVGVTDLVDIKFYENRANGQSRGFCTVAVASHESMQKLMDKIKTVQIHSQTLNVHYCNRNNLLMLDAASGGNRAEVEMERERQYNMQQQSHHQQEVPRFPPRIQRPPFPGGPGGPRPPMMMGPRAPMSGPPRGPMPGPGGPHQGPPLGPRPLFGPPPGGMPPRGPPGMGPGPPGMGPGMGMPPGMNQQGPPRGPPQQQPPHMGGSPQIMQPHGPHGHGGMQGPPGPHQQMPPHSQPGMMPGFSPHSQSGSMPPNNFPGPPNMQPSGLQPTQGMMPVNGMQPGMMPQQQQQPPQQMQTGSSGMPPHSQPAAHVNPAFFPGGQPPPQTGDPFRAAAPVLVDQFGRPLDGQMLQPGMPQHVPPAALPQEMSSNGLSEDEMQEILTRNKSVSSSAISRAVQDASQGDFASAIETLVTAISLIKQSKIANDDRCKILIASLQDTKAGIEDKSYGSSSKYLGRDRRSYSPQSRDRRRSRSRERDRERRRERTRSRERERRDYRERSRERDRGSERSGERERERSAYYQERSSRGDRYY